MKTRSFVRSSRRAVSMALLVGTLPAASLFQSPLFADPYEVDSIGNWPSDTNQNSLAWVLRQTDVTQEGILLTGDLDSVTWTGWTTGTNGAIRLLPSSVNLGSAILDLNLDGHTIAGKHFSFVTGTGTFSLSNGIIGSMINDLYFGLDGQAQVMLTDMHVSANSFTVGKDEAAYNGTVSLSGTILNTNTLTIYTNDTETKVDINDIQPSFVATDSSITLSNGALLISGEGNELEGFPVNDKGEVVMQQYDDRGNLMYDVNNDPILVMVDDGEGNLVPKTTSKDYYYSTARLIDSSLSGVRVLEIKDGASLVLFGNSSISTQDLLVSGSGKNYSSALRGTGALTWTGDMTVEGGGWIDFSRFYINGESIGSLYIGKNTAQNLYITGGQVTENPNGTRNFKSSRFVMAGALTLDNGSYILIKDAASVSGITNISLIGGSRMEFTGALAYDPVLREYIPSNLNARGNLTVTDGSILSIVNGWRLNMRGNDTLATFDNATIYVGVDFTKTPGSPPADNQGEGVHNGIQTQLNLEGNLVMGTTNGNTTELRIQGGARVRVDGSATIGDAAGSIVDFSLDKSYTSSGYASSLGSSFSVGKDLIVGKNGSVTLKVGDIGYYVDPKIGTSVLAGSTVLASGAGSTAMVTVDAAPKREYYNSFYYPSVYAWRVNGQGKTNLNDLRAAGNSSFTVNSGLVYIENNGVFSMAGQSSTYDNGYGIASFNGSSSELRLYNGTFSNQGTGAASTVGQINFTSGAMLSGTGKIYAGESITFNGSTIAPGSRFLYDDIEDDEEGPLIIGNLDLYVNKSNSAVTLDSTSQIWIALSGESATGGTSDKIIVHNTTANLSEGIVLSFYRLFEGSYKILETPDNTISGNYAGYTLKDNPQYFALNGNPLYIDASTYSARILQGSGNITTYYKNNGKELWVDIADVATSGNVHTIWTGASSGSNAGVWDMYARNWDATTTKGTEQYLDGDIVTFQDDAPNRTIKVTPNHYSSGVTIAAMNVLGDYNWDFSEGGIIAYNSELYSSLKLDDPDPNLRPTGKLVKIGSGTLTFHNSNQFYGGVHLGDSTTTGGLLVLDNERALGNYDLSVLPRGIDKGTVFVYDDSEIQTTDKVKNLNNRFVVYDGQSLTLNIANDELTISGDLSNGLDRDNGGGALHLQGSLNTTKDLVFSGNYAGLGGSILMGPNGQLNANSLTVSGSFAMEIYNGGGGIYHAGNIDTTLKNLTLLQNNAYGSGGGLMLVGSGALTLTGETLIESNQSGIAGGGIYLGGTSTLILEASGDIIFDKNLTTVAYKDPEAGKWSLNPSIKTNEAFSNAIHLATGTALEIHGDQNVFFYDPISGDAGSAVTIGDDPADTATIVFHGNSVYAGDTAVGGNVTFRLENGDTLVAGSSIKDSIASYGVQAVYEKDDLILDYTQWTATASSLDFGADTTLTGSGVIGSTTIVQLDGILNLDDGSEYDPSTPFATETLGTLHILGNTTVADTAVWHVTLDKGVSLPTGIRLSDTLDIYGSLGFTGAVADKKLDIYTKDLIRGKYILASTTTGISGYNTDKKLSGAPIWWEYASGQYIDLATTGGLDGVTEAAAAFYGRARAVTYAEGNNLYLHLTARNRHVIANEDTGIWRDNNLWEFTNASVPTPGDGNLTTDWKKNDTGPVTDVYINGDMVTFSPTTGITQTYTIEDTVRPVDLFISGTGNVVFEGSGVINTYSQTLASDQEATSIRPNNGNYTDADNDYGISLYTGKLYKQTDTTLTFAGTNTSGNMFTHGIDVGTTANKGGIIQFGYGSQLNVSSSSYITFINDGILRYIGGTGSTATTLTSKIAINDSKVATFDVGSGLTLTQSGQISDITATDFGHLKKVSEGTLVLSNSNTFKGGATFGSAAGADSGTIQLNANYALGAAYNRASGLTNADITGLITVTGKATLTKDNNNRSLYNRFDVTSQGSLTISSATNYFYLQNANANELNGGAINVASDASAQLALQGNGGLYFSANKAASGGAIYTANTGALNATIQYLYLLSNEATAGSGGAIYSLADISLNGTYFNISSNTASVHGGAIYAANNSVSLSNTNNSSSYTNNKALGGSGGFVYAKNITINNNYSSAVSITGNSATDLGGAFYLNNGLLTLNANNGDISLSGNTATTAGEAAYISGTNGAVAISGTKNTLFYDTLVSDTASRHSLTKTGTGALMFAGTGAETNNNAYHGNILIQAGNIRITQNTSLGVNATSTTFDLNSAAFLTGGGTIGAELSTLSGVISADTDTGLRSESSSAAHSYYSIGNLRFDGNVTLNNAKVFVDMQQPASGGYDALGTADTLTATGTLASTSSAAIDLYNYGFGEYLLITAGSAVNADTSGYTFTVHGQQLTDRHSVNLYRGDNANITNSSSQNELWAKTIRHNLYMYWTGANNVNWNPYDTDSLTNENWVNKNNGSGNPAEGHVLNGDTVYFGDSIYNYAADDFSGGNISRSTITLDSRGVIVTDLIVNNTIVNYTFNGGAISTIGTYEGTVLSGTPGQHLLKQGSATLTLNNTSNTFGGQLKLENGSITFGTNNTANTFTGGIFYNGVANDSRTINYRTAAQLGNASITFNQSGTLAALGTADHSSNLIAVASNATATINNGTNILTTLSATADISGAGNLTKTGAGTLQIASSGTNALSGNTTISNGTFRLANAASYGTAASANVFSQANTATLAGNGTINAHDITLSGAITPDGALLSAGAPTVPSASYGTLTLNSNGGDITLSGITYSYDMGTAASDNKGNTATGDLIQVTGAGKTILNGSNTLNLSSGTLNYGDYYLLIDSNTTITSDGTTAIDPSTAFAAIKQDGTYLSPRIGTDIIFGLNPDSSVNNKQLWLATSRNTLDLVWNLAGNGTWDQTTENWKSIQSNNGIYATSFNHGDYIHLTDAPGTADKTINVDATAIVSGFEVNATGNHTITGSNINAITQNPAGQNYLSGKYISDGSLIPDGRLTKTGSGTLTLANTANNFAGGICLKNGTLSISSAAHIADTPQAGTRLGINFIGNATLLSTASDLSLTHGIRIGNGVTASFQTNDKLTLTGVIANDIPISNGILAKTGTGTLTLTAASTYSGGTLVKAGTLLITGDAASAGNAGSSVTLTTDSTFHVGEQNTTAYILKNTLLDETAGTSTGTLIVNTRKNTNDTFAFGSSSAIAGNYGINYSGQVEMQNATYQYDAVTEAFFSGGASLATKTGSSGSIASKAGSDKAWNLKNTDLHLDGGSITWTYGANNALAGIIAVKNITAGNNTTDINLNLGSALQTPTVEINDGNTFFHFQTPVAGDTLLLASSETDISSLNTANLNLKLYIGGVEQSGTQTSQIITQGSTNVADGIFDWGAYTTDNKELRVGYKLTEIQIYDGKTLFVILGQNDTDNNFAIHLTDKNANGGGNVYLYDYSDAHLGINLTSANSYTGVTTIGTNTVITTTADYAFGDADNHTSELRLNVAGGQLNLGATTQYIGSLTTGASGNQRLGMLNLGTGTLTIDNGGSINGDAALIGGGIINLTAGTLTVFGSNAPLSSTINNAAASTIVFKQTNGLGNTGNIANLGTITFDGAIGNLSKTVSENGAINLINNAKVTVTGDNSNYTGRITINSGSVLTVGENKHIGTGTLGGAGTLQKNTTGTLTIDYANADFTGHTNIIAGKMVLKTDNAIGTGIAATNTVTVHDGATTELGGSMTTYAHNTDGDGTVLVSGTNSGNGIDIVGTNTLDSNGKWQITGIANITGQDNLGDAAVYLDDSGNTGSTLNLDTTGDYNFTNVLSGDGTLHATLGDTDNYFTLDATAGTDFTGTLHLENSSFELGGNTAGNTNAAALANATLQVGTGNQTRILGDATIGNLTIDGGRVNFALRIPPDNEAAGIVTATNIHIIGNQGEIGIDTDLSSISGFDNPVAPTERNILDQDNIGTDAIHLANGTVTGDVSNLQLVDVNGNPISSVENVNISENGVPAAIGTYDYSLTTGTNSEGLYIDYTLTQLDLQATGDNALTLDNQGSLDNILHAKLTGNGNLAINANTGEIVLSNSNNDFTGNTTILTGTLVNGTDNALGSQSSHTAKLSISAGAAYDLDGYTQNIGELDNQAGASVLLSDGTLIVNDTLTSADATINFGNGTLKVNAGGTISGDNTLIGDTGALLHVDPSDLIISGANTNYHGNTLIEGDSSITLDHTYGLGDGTITLDDNFDTLAINITTDANAGAAQAIKNTIEGSGTLHILGTVENGEVYIDKANTDFTGTTLVEHGTLIATHLEAVGSSSINVENTDSLFTWEGVTGTTANQMTGDGTIAFIDSDITVGHATTAANYDLNQNSKVTLTHENALGTDNAHVSIDNSSLLQLNTNVILGNVSNNGRIAFNIPSDPTGSFIQGTATTLSGNGSIEFNTNFSTLQTDHLTVLDSTSGTQMVLVRPVGEIPTTGDGVIPIIETQNFISSSGAFKLPTGADGKETVEVGSYAYALRQGNGTAKTPNANEWYLIGDSLSKAAESIIGTAAGMGLGWHIEMDTLLKRMGDIRVSKNASLSKMQAASEQGTPVEENNGMQTWGRAYGWEMNASKKISGSSFTEYYYGGDAGLDKHFRFDGTQFNGDIYTGLFLGGGRTSRDFNGFGDGHTEMYRGGLYLTYMDDSGWYGDLLGKLSYYENEFTSKSTYGDRSKGDYDQWGAGVSLEIGKQIPTDDNIFTEPQIQFSYGHINGQSYNTKGDLPIHVSIETQDTVQLRGGMRFGKHIPFYGTFTPYAKGSVVGMWTDGGQVRTSDGLSKRAVFDGARVEVGGGITWETNDYGQFYLDYEYITGERFDIPWKVNVGFRFDW